MVLVKGKFKLFPFSQTTRKIKNAYPNRIGTPPGKQATRSVPQESPQSQIQNLLTCKVSDDNNKEATLVPPQEYLTCFTTKLDKDGKD
jgi:hypothetical protein